MYAGKTEGTDVRIAKWAISRYHEGLIPAEKWSDMSPHFGPAMRDALVKVIQPQNGIRPTGNIGQATWDVLWQYLDAYRRQLYRLWKLPTLPRPSPLPDLGPLYVGGVSVLDHSLTHETAGIAHYPAFDDGWIVYRPILAPENVTVTKASSATVGDAFYASGVSKLDYWFGHLVVAPAVGATFRKGQYIGSIAPQNPPHVHLGVNARRLIGHDLEHHTDYTNGAPTIRTQLKEALSL